MPRLTLDREIRLIQDETLLLGSLVEQAVLNAVDALKSRDAAAARAVIRNDIFINDKRFAIENRILILFATQSPMARDLRLRDPRVIGCARQHAELGRADPRGSGCPLEMTCGFTRSLLQFPQHQDKVGVTS